MANEWLFDPFQAEEEDIKAKQLKAMTIALRALPQRDMGDFTSRTNDIFSQANAERELEQIPAMREALSQKYQQSLARALSGESEETRKLGESPQTAPLALGQVKSRLDTEADEREISRIKASFMSPQGGPEGADGNEYQMALAMATSSRPRVAAVGKVLLDSMKAYNPQNTAQRSPSGQVQTLPGAIGALNQQTDAMGGMVRVPNGQGGWDWVPKSQAIPGGGGLVPPVNPAAGQSPGPGAPPMAPTPVPPVGQPSGAGSSVVPPVPPSGPAPLAPGANMPPQFNFTGTPEQQAALRAQAMQFHQQQPPTMTEAGAGAPQGMPSSGAIRPTAAPRSELPPMDVKQFEGIQSENEKSLQKWTEQSKVPELKESIAKLRELNSKPMYTGYTSVPMALENTMGILGVGKSEKGKNVEQFEKHSGDLVAGILTQYGSGNGISDADMRAATMRIPNPGMDPESRAALIDSLEEKVNFMEYADKRVPQLVRQNNYTLAAAKDIAYTEFQQMKSQTKMPGATPPIVPGKSESKESPLSQTLDAVGDTVLATGLGAANLFGLGDRKRSMEEMSRQEERAKTDETYGTARDIANIAKFAPALAMGPAGAAVYAGSMGASQPRESPMSQIMEGAKGAALGYVGGGVGGSGMKFFLKSQESNLKAKLAEAATGGSVLTSKAVSQLRNELRAVQEKIAEIETLGTVVGKGYDMITSPLRGTLNILRGR